MLLIGVSLLSVLCETPSFPSGPVYPDVFLWGNRWLGGAVQLVSTCKEKVIGLERSRTIVWLKNDQFEINVLVTWWIEKRSG